MTNSFDLNAMTPEERADWEKRSYVRTIEEQFRRLFFDQDKLCEELLVALRGELIRAEYAENRISILRQTGGIDEIMFDAFLVLSYGYLHTHLASDL